MVGNLCEWGPPLLDFGTGEAMPCLPGVAECPGEHQCVTDPISSQHVCCPTPSSVEKSKFFY